MQESQTTLEARYLLTRFSRSLHPRGMITGAPPQTATPAAPDPGNTPPSPASMSLCRHGYNNGPPLIFMRSPGYKSLTRTLHPTANTTPSLNVTNQYTIFDTIPTNSTLANIHHLEVAMRECPCTPDLGFHPCHHPNKLSQSHQTCM
jgi:hypothetical protein